MNTFLYKKYEVGSSPCLSILLDCEAFHYYNGNTKQTFKNIYGLTHIPIYYINIQTCILQYIGTYILRVFITV